MVSTKGQNYVFILSPEGRMVQTYMDILEGASSSCKKLQTRLCKKNDQRWQLQKGVSVGKKDNSTATDLHILRLKLNRFCGPSKFHLTGSLGCIKSCLENKERGRWEIIYTSSDAAERDEDNRRRSRMVSSNLRWFNKYPFLNRMSIMTALNKTPAHFTTAKWDMVELLKHVHCRVVQTLNPNTKK